jgi:hypothetical protein
MKLLVDSSKFLYFGENLERKADCFYTEHRHRIHDQDLKTPIGEKSFNMHTQYLRSSSRGGFTPHSRIKRNCKSNEKINEKTSLYKRRPSRDPSSKENMKGGANFYIEQLLTMPITKKKILERTALKTSPLRENRIRLDRRGTNKKVGECKFTNTDDLVNCKAEPLIVVGNLTIIDEVESPSPTFKPRYL